MRRLLVLALFASLSTAAQAKKEPWAEIDGTLAGAATADQAAVAVVEVDGKAYPACKVHARGNSDSTGSLFADNSPTRGPKANCVTATKRMKVAPGQRVTTIATIRAATGGGIATQPFAFEAAACTRYRLVAEHDGPVVTRFRVVVAAQEPIAGCTAPALAATVAPAAAEAAPDVAPAPEAAGAVVPSR